jgi:hypothetical protein
MRAVSDETRAESDETRAESEEVPGIESVMREVKDKTSAGKGEMSAGGDLRRTINVFC